MTHEHPIVRTSSGAEYALVQGASAGFRTAKRLARAAIVVTAALLLGPTIVFYVSMERFSGTTVDRSGRPNVDGTTGQQPLDS